MRRALTPVMICLLAATVASAAWAQSGGGQHHGGGGGPPSAAVLKKRQAESEIVGVVKAIDAATARLTISYDAVESMNWPPGTQPFPVAKSAMLNGITVGEKVRFTLDSGEIATLKPF